MNRNGPFQSLALVAAAVLLAIAMTGCNLKPTAAFEASVTSGEAPLTVVFTDNSTTPRGEITAWAWDFDDGGTSTQQNPTHIFDAAGTFNVSLTVTNSHNRNDTASATITVGDPDDPDEGEPEEGEPEEGEVEEGESEEGELEEGEPEEGETEEGEPEEGESEEGEPEEGETEEGEPEEGEPEEGETEEGEPEVPAFALGGWVKTTDELILPGATVMVLDTDAVTHTDAHGLYTFSSDDVSGASVVVKVEKAGFATSSVLVELTPGEVTFANFTLIALAPPVPLNSEAGGTADDGGGNKLIVPANAFVRRDNGKSVSGEVDVHITPLDIYDDRDIAAFPGEFRAVAAGDKSTETVQLETFALADFTVMQDGVDLDLASNKNGDAYIELALSDESPLIAGDTVPLWYFDAEQGLWIEKGTGMVELNKVGQLVYRAAIPHLSWWNADVPVSQTDCFTGIVLDEDGEPLAGARVESQGIDYRGASYATTNALGEFCIDIKRNSQARLDLYLPGGGTVLVDSMIVDGLDMGLNCAAGGCPPLPDPLTATLDGCVTGEVFDDLGTPLAGVTVYTNLGSTAVTDENGWFCMNTVSGVSGSFFVAGRPPVAVTMIPEGDCATGDCAHVVIDVDFPRPGDHLGIIYSQLEYVDRSLWGGDSGYDLNAHAYFLLGTGAIAPEFGCTVTLYDYDDDWNFEEEFWENGFGRIDWTTISTVALDPGAPGEVVESTREIEAAMFRLSGEDGTQFPFAFGIFELDWYARSLFEPGDTLVYTWPGGMDIGAFSTPPTVLPTEPVVITPELSNNMDIDFDEPLNVTWTPLGVDMVTISVQATAYTFMPEYSYAAGTVECVVADTGSYIIPADLLQQLPEDPGNGFSFHNVVFTIAFGNFMTVEGIPLTSGGDGTIALYTYLQKSGNNGGIAVFK